MSTMRSAAYLLPTNELYGGIRLAIEQAEGLARRGWRVEIFAPAPAPDWHPLSVLWQQVDFASPVDLSGFDAAIGTFYTTVPIAAASGARQAFHLCQGFEGVHREYAPILDRIEAAYQLPIPKLLISAHLEPILQERFSAECHLLGQAIDHTLFRPAATSRPFEVPTVEQPLVVGVVGPFSIRSKGIRAALDGLALARAGGVPLEVHRASSERLDDQEAELGVVDRYCHRVPTSDMPDFYQGLDLLLFSSWDEEGFPLPPLEAMACKIPVVLTDISAFKVLPADAAWRCHWDDPPAFAEAIRALAANPDRRRQLAERGAAAVGGMTFDAMIDRLEEALERSLVRAEGMKGRRE